MRGSLAGVHFALGPYTHAAGGRVGGHWLPGWSETVTTPPRRSVHGICDCRHSSRAASALARPTLKSSAEN